VFCGLVRQEDLPKSEDDQSDAASDDSSDYIVRSSMGTKFHPRQGPCRRREDLQRTRQDQPIETQKHILGLRASMQHLEGGRVTEEVPAEGRSNVDRDHEVEATSPLD
jgi:hypothetical protein